MGTNRHPEDWHLTAPLLGCLLLFPKLPRQGHEADLSSKS